jgi:DNA-binding protein HU-beta
MNKNELVDAIAKGTGLTKTKSNEVVNSIVSAITESLRNGEKVSLVGFGTWTTSKRAERKGRNPRTGEEITIPGKTVAKFKPGNELTKNVN